MNRQVAILSRVFAEKLTTRCAGKFAGNAPMNANINININATANLNIRTLASSSKKFRAKRRAPKALQSSIAPKRKTRSKKQAAPHVINPNKGTQDPLGPQAASTVEYMSKHGSVLPSNHESVLRAADYFTADVGSTEDLVGERRALMDASTPEEAAEFSKNVDALIEASKDDNTFWKPEEHLLADDKAMNRNDTDEDPLQRAYGPWSETIVRVDRVQKVQRGGTVVSYRALVIGGNLNGCAGFGVAKASAPNDAARLAAKVCKRNIFFIDRYLGTGLTSDLVGRQNSCKVTLWSVNPNRGLHGHPLVQEIMKYFGITDCTAKSHGNRNVYNVVRATFKAIMTHESLEDVAMKRGKRLMNLERAKRLKI